MKPPVLVERAPTASQPVVVPELRRERARKHAGVITGGALLAVNVGLLIYAAVIW